MTIFKEIYAFSRKISRRSSYYLLCVDAACFTDIDFCVVSQRFMSISFSFKWDKYLKPMTSMLIGTSPELELALFTLCYKTRPDKDCYVSLGGTRFKIYASTADGQGLRSVYFVL